MSPKHTQILYSIIPFPKRAVRLFHVTCGRRTCTGKYLRPRCLSHKPLSKSCARLQNTYQRVISTALLFVLRRRQIDAPSSGTPTPSAGCAVYPVCYACNRTGDLHEIIPVTSQERLHPGVYQVFYHRMGSLIDLGKQRHDKENPATVV